MDICICSGRKMCNGMNFIQVIMINIFIVFFVNFGFAQSNNTQDIYSNILKINKAEFPLNFNSIIIKESTEMPVFIDQKTIDFSAIRFNCNELAPFCRLEWKMEKAVRFPIKFRIGEVQYVEQLEGKY